MIKKVSTAKDVNEVVALAKEIWTDHYTPFLADGQVPYMLQKFQSRTAIKRQMAEGHNYFLIGDSQSSFGYFDFVMESDVIFISKFYLLTSARSKGFGKRVLDFITERAKEAQLLKLRLTVNKYNGVAISFYQKAGFIQSKSVVVDIGNGFVMDDFVYEKGI